MRFDRKGFRLERSHQALVIAQQHLLDSGPPSRVRSLRSSLRRTACAGLPAGAANEVSAPRRLVGLTRFELVTPRLSSVCSNQLSYRPRSPLPGLPGRTSLARLLPSEGRFSQN